MITQQTSATARHKLQSETRLADLILAGHLCDATVLCTSACDAADTSTPERVHVVRAVLAASCPSLEQRFVAASEMRGCEVTFPITGRALRCVIAFSCGAVPQGFDLYCSESELRSAEVFCDLPHLKAWCHENQVGPHTRNNDDIRNLREFAICGLGLSGGLADCSVTTQRSNWLVLLSSAVIVSAALLAWKPCLSFKIYNNGFFMDDSMIARNPNVYMELDFRRLLRTDYWGLDMFEGRWTHKSFRPLTVLTFRWNYVMHGFDSTGWHITNLLLHLACSVLLGVFGIVSLDLPLSWATLLSSIFFSHPVHTENVLYIVGRADLLCCSLILISGIIYARWCMSSAPVGLKSAFVTATSLFISSVLTVAAGLCKETGFCFFGLLVGWEILRACQGHGPGSSRRGKLSQWARILTLLVLGGCASCIRFWYTGGTVIKRMDPHSNPVAVEPDRWVRTLSYSLLHGIYGKLLVWPTFLCYDYSFDAVPLVRTIQDVRLLLPLAAYLVFASLFCCAMLLLPSCRIIATRLARGGEAPIVGLAILMLSFLPMSNILFPVGTMIGERLLYVPSAGLLITCVGLGHQAEIRFEGPLRRVPTALLLAAGTGSVWLTMQRVPEWSSPEAITVADAKIQLRSARVQYNLATYYLVGKRYDEALTTYQHVISIDPSNRDSMPLYHSGQILLHAGRHAEAERYLAIAVAGYYSPLMVNEEEVFHDYALSKWFVDDPAGAIENFEKSLILNTTFAKGYNNMGCAAGLGAFLGKVPQQYFSHGVQAVQRALQLSPSSILYMRNLVALLLMGGEIEVAEQIWNQLLALDPNAAANGAPQDCTWEFNFR